MKNKPIAAAALLTISGSIFLSSLFEASTWNSFPAYISCIADVVMATCAVVALRSWRKQVDYVKVQEIAEEIISKADVVRGALHGARNPAIVTSDDLTFEKDVRERLGANAYDLIPAYRLDKRQKEIYDLQNSAWRCDRFLGQSASDATARFILKVNDIRMAAMRMAVAERRLRDANNSPEESAKINAERGHLDDIVHGHPDEPTGIEIDNAFNDLLVAMRPFMPGYVS